MNAPGQSENPDSPHFSDLASVWSAGDLFPLAFSDAAVEAHAETTLTLLPAARKGHRRNACVTDGSPSLGAGVSPATAQRNS